MAKYRKSNPDVAELLKAVPVEFASSANAAAKATLDASKKATKGFGKFMSDSKRARIAGKTLRWGAYTSPLTVGGATYLLWPDSENSEVAGDTATDQSRDKKPEEVEKPKEDEKSKKDKKTGKFNTTGAVVGGGVGGIAGALAAYALSERKNRLRNMLITGAITGGAGAGVGGFMES